MTCRDDTGYSWYKKMQHILHDIKLIWATRMEALEIYSEILGINTQMNNEIIEVTTKLILCARLGDLVLKKNEPEEDTKKTERVKEILLLALESIKNLDDFSRKWTEMWKRLEKENKYWQDFLKKESKSFDEMKRMKMEERKQFLRKCVTCLALYKSGRGTFEKYQDEWDGMKAEMHLSVVGYLKELVVIAMDPKEAAEIETMA